VFVEVDGDELVDAAEIAARLGLKNGRQVLDLRVHRLGFPDPVGRQGRRLMWSWSRVESWSVVALVTLASGFFASGPLG
jgi:hypothetical protein